MNAGRRDLALLAFVFFFVHAAAVIIVLLYS
jgi:DMSO/TMAO reductase YedYZ heme-binding membrane subunit